MSIRHNLIKLLEIVKNFDDTKQDYTINEIIEFYNVTIFINNNLFLTKWSEDEVKLIKDSNKQFKILINKLFSSISGINLGQLYDTIDWNYKDNFWEIIEKFNTFNVFTENEFIKFINQNSPDLRNILRNKKTVSHFDTAVKGYIMSNPINTEVLIDNFEVHDNQFALHLPKSLSIKDKELLIVSYINSSNPNLNYLRLLAIIQNNKDKIVISDKVRLTAIKKTQEIENRMFANRSGFNVNLAVKFREQEEKVLVKSDKHSFEYSYSTKWIKENNDYSTLLINFIHLFKYVDQQMRISLTKNISEMGTIERIVILRSQNSYSPGMGFINKNNMANLQMIGYYNQLEQMDIFLEDIIEWFFQEYLLTEFKAQDYRIKIPSKEAKYFEKCRSILPEMESILKQFNLYVDDGKIDHELLQISSEHLLLRNCKSLIEKKYIYADNNDFQRITHYFFSDQCMLAYIERISKRYNNFYELIRKESINMDDFADYQIPDLNWLLENNFIEIKDNKIGFSNLIQILILKDLYFNDVINYLRYPPEIRTEIDKFIDKGLLKSESSLFSKPEQDYLNYHLNKSTFNDSLDLRNKYSHGTQPNDKNDEDIHKVNYMIILKLLILIIFKINDEFCLADE
ncbi:MAG: hypothetical protein P9L97_12125 [Candidatus Tenebribacter davisii]|jgi:hypothetical protein|nr:hypothetical protein [Candidatus Tenebribacter davisii]